MFIVLECVSQQHDAYLVLLALLVGSLGCFTMFLALDRSTDCLDSRQWFWVAVASIAAGVGVWSTHFISMLAYKGAMPLGFDPGLTISSVVVAILLFWGALKSLGREVTLGSSALGGLIAAAGVSAMHFTGMAAVIAPAVVRYNWPIICMGYGLVLVAFAAAFLAFGRLRGWKRLVMPASLAVFGVAGLHFTAMSATTLVPVSGEISRYAQTSSWLVPGIVAAVLTLVALGSGGAVLDRLLTDLRGIADAALEGLAIISGGRIVEANSQLGKLLGRASSDLIGTDPARWLAPSDGLPLDAPRARPAEALIRRDTGEELVVEIAPHMVEYRGRPCQVLAVRDLTDRKRAERQIEHLATHDSLTGLPNRVKLSAVLEDLALRHEPFALLALDLDRFKAVNDTFGHAAGDALLCRVSGLLKMNVRDLDLVARVGGDEFLIIQRGVTEAGARQLATSLLRVFAEEMNLAPGGTSVGVSIGIALFPRDGATLEDVRHHADVALYQAKQSGRGTACFFDRDLDRVMRDRRQIERDLERAIGQEELHLVYQPIIATANRRVTGYEALLRWRHPRHGFVLPQRFIPIAEESGSIVQLGEWVLRTACTEASGWPGDLRIAVNVSAIQIESPDFAETVEHILSTTRLSPSRLELEVTESVMLRNSTLALATLQRLKARGIRIVMDDFGTGYSSLSNLQAFPFDKIKIDRGFIGAMEYDEAALSIVRAVVGLGTSLRLPIVAEGVETEEQYGFIIREGCAEAQGYLFGAPSATVQIQPPLRLIGA